MSGISSYNCKQGGNRNIKLGHCIQDITFHTMASDYLETIGKIYVVLENKCLTGF